MMKSSTIRQYLGEKSFPLTFHERNQLKALIELFDRYGDLSYWNTLSRRLNIRWNQWEQMKAQGSVPRR